jgi:curli biogenesis system outer membrane secretion channel CsgG
MSLDKLFATFFLLCVSCTPAQDFSNLQMPVQLPVTFALEKNVFFSKNWNVVVMKLDYDYGKEGQVGETHWSSNGQNGGQVVAGLLASELGKLNNIHVVERATLDKVIAEQVLQQSGAVSDETIIKFGQIVGAEAVITGELTDYVFWDNKAGYGSTIAFSIRMIDVQSGRIIFSSAISRSRMFVDVMANCQLAIKEVIANIQN